MAFKGFVYSTRPAAMSESLRDKAVGVNFDCLLTTNVTERDSLLVGNGVLPNAAPSWYESAWSKAQIGGNLPHQSLSLLQSNYRMNPKFLTSRRKLLAGFCKRYKILGWSKGREAVVSGSSRFRPGL